MTDFSFDFGFGFRAPGVATGTSHRYEYSVIDNTSKITGAVAFTGVFGALELSKLEGSFDNEQMVFDYDVKPVQIKYDKYNGLGGGFTIDPEELEAGIRLGYGTDKYNGYFYATVGIDTTDYTQSYSNFRIETTGANGVEAVEVFSVIGKENDFILVHQTFAGADGTRFQQTFGVHKDGIDQFFDEQKARDEKLSHNPNYVEHLNSLSDPSSDDPSAALPVGSTHQPEDGAGDEREGLRAMEVAGWFAQERDTQIARVEIGEDGVRTTVNAVGNELWNDSDYVGTHVTSTGGTRQTVRVEGGYVHTITTSQNTTVTYTESVNEDGSIGADPPVAIDLDGDGIEVAFGTTVFLIRTTMDLKSAPLGSPKMMAFW